MGIGTQGGVCLDRGLAGLDFQVLSAQQNELSRALKIVVDPVYRLDMRVPAGVGCRRRPHYPPANRFNIRFTEGRPTTGHESKGAVLACSSNSLVKETRCGVGCYIRARHYSV